jgi:hypothetical protein
MAYSRSCLYEFASFIQAMVSGGGKCCDKQRWIPSSSGPAVQPEAVDSTAWIAQLLGVVR